MQDGTEEEKLPLPEQKPTSVNWPVAVNNKENSLHMFYHLLQETYWCVSVWEGVS